MGSAREASGVAEANTASKGMAAELAEALGNEPAEAGVRSIAGAESAETVGSAACGGASAGATTGEASTTAALVTSQA